MTTLSAAPRATKQPRCWLGTVAVRALAMVSLAVALLYWSPPAGSVELDEAVAEVRAAATVLGDRIDALPRQGQLEIGTDVRFLARTIEARLRQLEQVPVAAVDASLDQELMFMADLVRVVAAEVEEIRGRANPEQEEQIQQLIAAATGSLERIGAVAGSWAELTRSSVVEITPATDRAVIRVIDRAVYDGVRFGALALLLLGLLACGLRLVALSEVEISLRDLVRQSPVSSLAGIAVVLLFLATSLAVVVRPATIATLAARVDAAPADPCQTLAIQRDQLTASRSIDHDGLRDAIKDRMRPVAQDCLGLDSQVAAVEAVEWIAANLDPSGTVPPGTATAAVARTEVMDREIERLIGTVESLRAASQGMGDVTGLAAAAALDGGAGGPVEEIAAEERGGEEETPAVRQVVTTDRVNFRAGPGTDQTRLGTLAEGTEAVLLREEGGWSNIQLEDGRSVFVANDYVRTAGDAR